MVGNEVDEVGARESLDTAVCNFGESNYVCENPLYKIPRVVTEAKKKGVLSHL